MPADFGVNVYRKSTGDLVSGKSAAKVSRVRTGVPRESTAPRSDRVENALVLRIQGDCVEALRPDAVSLNLDDGGAKRSSIRERQWHSVTHEREAENILGLEPMVPLRGARDGHLFRMRVHSDGFRHRDARLCPCEWAAVERCCVDSGCCLNPAYRCGLGVGPVLLCAEGGTERPLFIIERLVHSRRTYDKDHALAITPAS